MTISRRTFLQASAAAGAVLAAPAIHAQSKRNKKYRTALIGSGWWGKVITEMAMADGSVDMIAVCDVDQSMNEEAVALIKNKSNSSPKQYKDFRELLEKEKPEICIVATPDHWHPLICIAACEAGAARLRREAGRSHDSRGSGHGEGCSGRRPRCPSRHPPPCYTPRYLGVQVSFFRRGRQDRHGPCLRGGGCRCRATRGPHAQPGRTGRARLGHVVRAGTLPSLQSRDPSEEVAAIPRLCQRPDWRLGSLDRSDHVDSRRRQAPEERQRRRRHLCARAHGEGCPTQHGRARRPDTLDVHWEFDDCVATWEHHQYGGNNQEKARIGCYFFGSKGVCHVGWSEGWTFYPLKKSEATIHEDPQLHKPGSQNVPELWADFIDAIEKRRRPVCDIEIGHHSTT